MKKHWFQCRCGMEGILLNDEEDILFLAIFSHGKYAIPITLKDKLRYCWKVLITGKPFEDEIILDKQIAKKLGETLLEWSNK